MPRVSRQRVGSRTHCRWEGGAAASSMAAMPTAIVTGASRGLGLALAHALADRGWRLVVDARDGAALEAAVAPLRHRTRSWRSRATSATLAPQRPRRRGRPAHRPPRQQRLGPRPLPAPHPRHAPPRRAGAGAAHEPGRSPRPRADRPAQLVEGARVINVSSDAAVEPYEGWGGYGTSKAALDQLSAILAAENPGLRVYAVDPGDMNTRMHQDAFPGEDISDRPPPEASVPGLLALIEGDLPSGRYAARALAGAPA